VTGGYVALLRGINVGGQNLVSMKALKESFERLRLREVRTYINSGNVVFRAPHGDAAALERAIDRMLSRHHAMAGKTVVRSETEMAELVRRIDRVWTPSPQWKCNVIFLRRHLDPATVLEAFSLVPGIERAVACPGTPVWSAKVSALGRTAMMKFGRSALYQDVTVRSVTTTRKILQLMVARDDAAGV
jgi:uncharacterized protein (DUF1697 family)